MSQLIDLRDLSATAQAEDLDDPALVLELQRAYGERLRAVAHGSPEDMDAARSRVERLEDVLLQRRRVSGVIRSAVSLDPSYYLG